MGTDAPCKLDQVLCREVEIISARRDRIRKRVGRPANQQGAASKDLVGLALSGGGIRSAATNLGILQGLSKSGMLQFADYLSTVSGGGYIGACLSSLLSNPRLPTGDSSQGDSQAGYQFADKDSPALFTTSWECFPFRDDHTRPPASRLELSGQEQMEHIRTRASYLTPTPRYLSDTVMRAMGAVTFTTLTPFFWFLLAVTLLTSVYLGIIAGLAPAMQQISSLPQEVTAKAVVSQDGSLKVACEAAAGKETADRPVTEKREGKSSAAQGSWQIIRQCSKQPFTDLIDRLSWKSWLTILLSGVLLGLGLPWALLQRPARKSAGGEAAQQGSLTAVGEDSEGAARRKEFSTVCWVIFGFLAGVLCFAAVALRNWEMDAGKGAMLLLPALSMAAAYLASSVLLVAVSRWPEESGHWTKQNRSTLNMIQGIFFASLCFTLLLALLPGLILASDAVWIAGVQVPLVFGLKFWLAGQNKRSSATKTERVPEKYRNWLLGLLVPLIGLLAVVWVGDIVISWVIAPARWPEMFSWESWCALLWMVLGSGALLAAFSHLVDVNKASPHYFYRDRLAEAFLRTFGSKWPEERKYGLVAKRDDTEMELKHLHGVGKETAAQCMGRGPYLLINATLNLTAAHDLKGFNRKGEGFTFSRAYVGSERTGYVPTESYERGTLKLARAMTISGAAATSVMGMNTSPLLSFACTILGVRLGYWLENMGCCRWHSTWQTLYRWFPATGRLLQELASYTDDQGPEIYLSDGGHSGDNLGILPLLRRRARVIIASDAECDPDHAFDSFNSSIRQAYVDEGIKISISLHDIYRKKDGRSARHYAVGRILYPDRPWQSSFIIILKNTMTKEEVAPLLNYQHKHHDFPHESTGDQFFTEEQFESYRALGRHAADEACRELFPWSVESATRQRLAVSNQDKDPWSLLPESIGQELKWRKVADPWDDLLVAMWEAEQGGFADWGNFKAMIERHAVTLACLNCHQTQKNFLQTQGLNSDRELTDYLHHYSAAQLKGAETAAKEREFWLLYRYVTGARLQFLRQQGPVPRSMKELRSFEPAPCFWPRC